MKKISSFNSGVGRIKVQSKLPWNLNSYEVVFTLYSTNNKQQTTNNKQQTTNHKPLIADIPRIRRPHPNNAIVQIPEIPILHQDQIIIFRKMKITTDGIEVDDAVLALDYVFIVVKALF